MRRGQIWNFWTLNNAEHVPRQSLVTLGLVSAGWRPPLLTFTGPATELEGTTVIVLMSACRSSVAWFSLKCLMICLLCATEKSGQEVMSKGSRGMEVILSSLEVSPHPLLWSLFLWCYNNTIISLIFLLSCSRIQKLTGESATKTVLLSE